LSYATTDGVDFPVTHNLARLLEEFEDQRGIQRHRIWRDGIGICVLTTTLVPPFLMAYAADLVLFDVISAFAI
jgi:hypothetical protein